jgi:hypothetical protein
MFDFRYHAISLAAVLIALLVGLLLGVAIGDQGLVSSAERDLRANLRRDVRDANRQVDAANAELRQRDRFADAVYPLLVGGQLSSRQIGVVFLGHPSKAVGDAIRNALEDTGASRAWVAVVREPLNLGELASRAEGTRYAELANDRSLVEPFARRMAIQLVQGGKLLERERRPLLRSLAGKLSPVDGVVIMRNAPDLKGDGEAIRDVFEHGFVAGVKDTEVNVVGVERTATDPSQIGWYADRGLTSVDNVDQVAGKAALVFALNGSDGAFGVKGTADALLPDVVGGVPSP